METKFTQSNPLPQSFTRDDLQRAFAYLRGRDLNVVKIEANSLLQDFLFEAGVGIPIEYVDTELGLKFTGRSSDNSEVEELHLRISDPIHAESMLTIVYEDPNLTSVRVWSWGVAPPCLKQFAEHGNDNNAAQVVLVPPSLFGVYIDWLEAMTVDNDPDFYMLPGGWQIYITTVS